jgi:hypothetical protein
MTVYTHVPEQSPVIFLLNRLQLKTFNSGESRTLRSDSVRSEGICIYICILYLSHESYTISWETVGPQLAAEK